MKKTTGIRVSFREKIILIVLGLFFCAALLEAGLRLGGWAFFRLQEQRNKLSLQNKGSYRILCLGESTTALGGENSYPRQLERILNGRNLGIQFSVINKGVTGTDSTAIAARLENNLDQYKPGMVIAMMGINDSGIYASYENMAEARGSIFRRILNEYRLFFRSLRVYKLTRLIQLHFAAKVKEEAAEAKTKKDEKKSDRKEELLKKAVEMYPGSLQAQITLGAYYFYLGKHKQAEQLFNQAIQTNGDNMLGYTWLWFLYFEQKRYADAVALAKRMIELGGGKNPWPYVALGCIYKDKEEFGLAEEWLKKAIRLDPDMVAANVELARYYIWRKRYGLAEELLIGAARLNSGLIYYELGFCYSRQERYGDAEIWFKKAVDSADAPYIAYSWLGDSYLKQKKYIQAEKVFKEILSRDPVNEKAYGVLATIYEETGRAELAEEYYQKINILNSARYNLATRSNYQKLKEILLQRGVRLVCVQYPMRSVEPLKMMLHNQEGLIFVDNEKIFKKAVAESGYQAYFENIFAGDFGHCTPKGNRLLAENIADTIIKELFTPADYPPPS